MIRVNDMAMLLPQPALRDVLKWATVTQASPLRIKVDGDSVALPFTPATLELGLAVNDRVLVAFVTNGDPEFLGQRAMVLGRAGGTVAVPAHTHASPTIHSCKVRTFSQNLNASSVDLQDISGLAIPVVAGTYRWGLTIPYEQSDNTPDIQVAMTFPATSSASYAFQALALAAAGSPPYTVNMGGGALVSGTSFVTAGTVGLRATITAYGHFVFTAAGTVQVRAAQQVSHSSVVTVHAGAALDMVLIT